MWWITIGRYQVTNLAAHELYQDQPENIRQKRNDRIRSRRLHQELALAIDGLKFERAAILRDILYPKGEKLFMLLNQEKSLYHRANFSGYTSQKSEAGKFTAREIGENITKPDIMVEVA